MRLEQAVGEFVADLRLAGRVDRTVGGHELELARLGRWLAEQGIDWQFATHTQLRQYARLRAELGHSSKANMMCSLRSFYRWSVEQNYVSMSPAAGFKTPRKPRPLPRSLTMQQVRVLVAAFAAVEGRKARRDEALLLTSVYAGLRAKELASLLWEHVDLDAGIISIVISKMQHGRVVPMHAELVQLLTTWWTIQGAGGHGPVFALDGRQFVANRVGKIARHWRSVSGVAFTAHILRHTFATWALRRSRDLYAVSKALGHAELRQTEIYVSADPEQLRAMVGALPGLLDW